MVAYDVTGRVATVTIDRPQARNAVNAAVASGIESALDRLEADDEVWVGVIAGAGTAFCAGADLKAIAAGEGAGLTTARGGFAGIASRERTKPLIAAVDGPALAGGLEIVLACDLVVASTDASFGIPEVKRSLLAGAGGLFRLPRALPRAIAMEMALTGDPIDTERAAHHGLVNVVVAAGQARQGALDLAARITANAPLAVRLSRAIVSATQSAHDAELWALTLESMARVVKSEDFQEGTRAFIDKRAPGWKGR